MPQGILHIYNSFQGILIQGQHTYLKVRLVLIADVAYLININAQL